MRSKDHCVIISISSFLTKRKETYIIIFSTFAISTPWNHSWLIPLWLYLYFLRRNKEHTRLSTGLVYKIIVNCIVVHYMLLMRFDTKPCMEDMTAIEMFNTMEVFLGFFLFLGLSRFKIEWNIPNKPSTLCVYVNYLLTLKFFETPFAHS